MAKLRDLVGIRSESETVDRSANATIEELRVPTGASETVRVFSDDATQFNTHYRDTDTHRGYVKCLGPECPFCRAGIRSVQKLVMLVYSVKQNSVVSLIFSPSADPYSLCPQLLDIIESSGGSSAFVKIARLNNFKWALNTIKPANTAIGTDVIAEFSSKFASTEQAASTVFKSMSFDEMMAEDDIQRTFAVEGLV